jgi:hypothetical protein
MFTLTISKFKALLIHFLVSLIILTSFFYILFKLWFPEPYFLASGGFQGLKLVALVDLILGPLLTFIVFNPLKSKLALFIDFTFIAVFQISALVWGVANIYQQRPVAIVFWENSFYTVPSIALSSQDFKRNIFGNKNPIFIYAKQPKSLKQKQLMLERFKKYQRPPHHQVELYYPIKLYLSDILKHSMDIQKVMSRHPQIKEPLEALLKQSKTTINSNFYIPLVSKYQNIVIVYSNKQKLIGYLSIPTE